MTNEQREIFSRVLDTNWEIKELREAGKFDKILEKAKEHNAAVAELKESMGEYEYNEFIRGGREMFEPVDE
jgi:hypothetical protein